MMCNSPEETEVVNMVMGSWWISYQKTIYSPSSKTYIASGTTSPSKNHMRNIQEDFTQQYISIYFFPVFCNHCELSLDLVGVLLTLLSALPVGLQFAGFFTASPHWSQSRAQPIKFYIISLDKPLMCTAGRAGQALLFLSFQLLFILKRGVASLQVTNRCAHSDYCFLKFAQTEMQSYFQEL